MMTKEEMLEKLKQEGVTDLDSLADFIVKKAYPDGDTSGNAANGVIIYNHGFVNH